jgi:hypothetical protein
LFLLKLFQSISCKFLQEYDAAFDYLTATVTALLWAVYQQAAAARVTLTAKDCPTLVIEASSK